MENLHFLLEPAWTGSDTGIKYQNSMTGGVSEQLVWSKKQRDYLTFSQPSLFYDVRDWSVNHKFMLWWVTDTIMEFHRQAILLRKSI
jgi:hypothetical protein